MADITFQQWLSFSVLGATVSTVGTLLGIVIKETLLADWSERRSAKRSLNKLLLGYREPLALTGSDLIHRLKEINGEYPPDWSSRPLDSADGARRTHTAARDDHFYRYKRQSTLYRFAAFLGWIECFRAEMAFMQISHTSFARKFNAKLEGIRQWLGDGGLNADWESNTDCCIYREELRAIGECMLLPSNNGSRVLGYAQFCAALKNPGIVSEWAMILDHFFSDLAADNDFRKTRLSNAETAISDLVELLAPPNLLRKILAWLRRHH